MTQPNRIVVALTSLAGSVDVEAKALATDLGATPYETRMKLAAGLPAIVLSTTDAEAANRLAGQLRARKHRASVCRAGEVVAASAMVSMRTFHMDGEGLDTGVEQVRWSDLSAIVHARTPQQTEHHETVKEKKFSLGRAVMSGGLVLSKTVKREVTTHGESSEHVLYLFRASGDIPWLMREHGTNYSGLGTALDPTSTRNFMQAIELFRRRAPHARFDDSLVRRSVPDIDLYAHLIATA
ncbi:MAG: hypothetical protein ABJE66_17200 [Deltaproteobacteria bacterium]